MAFTPRLTALRGRGGGAPTLLPIAAGDAVRTGGVDGLESGRGILEGVCDRSIIVGGEIRMDERSGGAGKSEEVLAWTGVSWTGGKVATEEVSTWTGVSWTGGKVATDEGTVVVVEVIEGKVVEETGTVVVVGEMVFIFVEFSLLALG